MRQLIAFVLLIVSAGRIIEGFRFRTSAAAPWATLRGGVGITVAALTLLSPLSQYIQGDGSRQILGVGLLAYGVLGIIGSLAVSGERRYRWGALAGDVLAVVLGFLTLTREPGELADGQIVYLGTDCRWRCAPRSCLRHQEPDAERGIIVASQMLNDATFAPGSATLHRESASTPTMTLRGTIFKSLLLLLVAIVFGAFGWNRALDWFSASSGLWWLIGYFLLIGLTIVAAGNPDLALAAGLLYAVLMGLWMGAVSRVYEETYDGIVAQALLASVAAFLACLVLYLTGAVRVTPNLTRAIITATLGIFVLYLVGWLLSLFGVDLLFITSPTPLGIALSVGICLVAAFNLFLDFAIVEKGIAARAPVAMEWYAAFGLLATLVWLYAELLRLLALLRNR